MTTSPESKLLPCPFCGGAPLSEIMDRHHLISCNDEECYAHPVVIVGKTEAIALSRWNKRAPGLPLEVVLSEENDRLIEALKDLLHTSSPPFSREDGAFIAAREKALAVLGKAEGRS